MEFSTESKVFLEALNFVSKGIASRTTQPILGNVLMEVSDKIHLRATNLVVDLSTAFDANIKQKGSIVIPATQLLRFLGAASKEVRVKVGKMMSVTSGGNIRLNIISADNYPASPRVNPQVTFEIDNNEFKDILNRVGFAVATDASRPILTGMYFNSRHSLIAGADGRRMAIYNFDYLDGDIEISLSQRGIEEVKHLTGIIKVEIGTKFSSFTSANRRVIVNHLAGAYPANAVGVANKVKTRIHPVEVHLDRISLLKILDVAISFQTGLLSVPIKLICDDKIRIEIESDVGNYNDTVAGEIIRGSISILLSPAQIIDAAKQVKSNTIVFQMGAPHQPILISDPDNENWIVVQVPIADREGAKKWEQEKEIVRKPIKTDRNDF